MVAHAAARVRLEPHAPKLHVRRLGRAREPFLQQDQLYFGHAVDDGAARRDHGRLDHRGLLL